MEADAFVRLRIIMRDGSRCVVAGCTATRTLELHHITPGGQDDPDNLLLLCHKHRAEIEAAGTAHTRLAIIAWDAGRIATRAVKDFFPPDNWQTWVYGGARNPAK